MKPKDPSPKVLPEKDVYMSPKKIIQRMTDIMHKHGFEEATKSDSFQQSRELWIAALFMSNQTYLSNKLYWLQAIYPKQEVPDVLAVSFRKPSHSGEKGIVQEVFNLEVSEYHDRQGLSLSESILKKLKHKTYPENTALLFYLDTHSSFQFIINKVILELNEAKPKINQIWLIFHPQGTSESFQNLVKVYPGKYEGHQQFNYGFMLMSTPPITGSAIDCALYNQPDFIKPQRGGNSVPIIESLGKYIIPLPDKNQIY